MLRIPRLQKPSKKFLFGSAFVGAFLFAAPAASAQEAPPPHPAALVQQVASDLEKVGIDLPSHDVQRAEQAVQQLQAAVDDGVAQAINSIDSALPEPARQDFATVVAQAGLPPAGGRGGVVQQLERLTQSGPAPLLVDPNYVWKNDGFSKLAAMKPNADFVLRRVPGSYFDAPRTPEESHEAMAREHSLYGPGTPLFVGGDMMCTLTAAGTDSAGRKVGLTAGHCGDVGAEVVSADSWPIGPSGKVVARNTKLDYAVIEFDDKAEISNEYDGVRAWKLGGGIKPGDYTCKRGVATGTTCGVVFIHERTAHLNHVCAMAGDSGAPLFKDGRVVGAVTGGLGNLPCRTPWQGILHSPTEANNMDTVLADLNRRGGPGAGFTLAGSR
ncbi:hypothetical protein CPHO_09330 [Corynebacterium phocae]|uniref:Secreted protein n=1 Tax=Corynebacterium phocae TaxID=161895 RepID=A0A1L7D546_9CORY|nr:S1 family peptidase [Corynebacterium phocae]APT93052.1 hypothetical protein CPHO_09330 [Corynebacterium phocae]KAA8722355.1 serine protease [Corynebacterium phocae]